MKSTENQNLRPIASDAAAAGPSTARPRAYEAPRLERHEDLPAITAVQSCDFFSTAGCS